MTIYQLQTQESSAADVGIVIEGIPVLNNLAILAGPVAISWDWHMRLTCSTPRSSNTFLRCFKSYCWDLNLNTLQPKCRDWRTVCLASVLTTNYWLTDYFSFKWETSSHIKMWNLFEMWKLEMWNQHTAIFGCVHCSKGKTIIKKHTAACQVCATDRPTCFEVELLFLCTLCI